VPRGQRDLSRPLRSRMAHHGLDRHARRGGGIGAHAGDSTPSAQRWRSASPPRSRSAYASSSDR
jgi:hypothetical protein